VTVEEEGTTEEGRSGGEKHHANNEMGKIPDKADGGNN
jgi:hypothetical protein